MKQFLKGRLPRPWLRTLQKARRSSIRRSRRIAEGLGFNISRRDDFYSPLPTETELLAHVDRWNRPSPLRGVRFNLEANQRLLADLLENHLAEFLALPNYLENQKAGFGLGFTEVDALVLYAMIRHLKPRLYLEIGSGLSTYYTSLAARRNATEGRLMQITCVEPYPFAHLYTIPHIHVIDDVVQNVPLERFTSLEAGDVLFIDSSHVLKLDGDVPYLYLEVLPALQPGVIIHIHDVAFPYNIPYPVQQWVTGEAESAPYWPVYWNEAMLLQAFLAFNDHFDILLSTAMLRHYCEDFLKERIPVYRGVQEEPNTFSSIWLHKRL